MTDFRILREAARVEPEWAVIDRIWAELDTPYRADTRLADLSPGQRAIYALTWIRSDVQNGGFHQCFSNPTGSLLPEAVEGAEVLGLPDWSQLLREAGAVFETPFPTSRERRQERLDRLTTLEQDAFESFDDRLYDLDDDPTTSLDLAFRRYIDAHPAEFFVDNEDEELAAATLLDVARRLVNDPPPRRLDVARDLLEEAVSRSRAAGTGRAAALAETLLIQLPDMTTASTRAVSPGFADLRRDPLLSDVRLRVDLDEPVEEPSLVQLADAFRRIADPGTYELALERAGVVDPASIACVKTTLGWYLTRRGDCPTDVEQGRFATDARALEVLVDWATRAHGWRDVPEFSALHPDPFPPVDLQPSRWVRSEWSEEGIDFFYEFNLEGIALRAIELQRPDSRPIAAASLVEWRERQRGLLQPQTPASLRYVLRYGGLPEGTERDWGDYPREDIEFTEFDRLWVRARKHLRHHPRGYP
jgi:GNAT superfamily N-acetyltransferase